MQLDNMLLQACKNNQKNVVLTFLKRGDVDVNKRDESGNTPLIYACLKSARDLVKLLLDNGADVSLGNQKNRTPLHFAAESGNYQIISLLLDAGADVNCTDNNGVTPLMVLAQNGRTDAALKLLQNPEIDISIKDNGSRMAIDYATTSGLRDLVQALSAAEHADAYGNTTLHHACWNNQGEVVKALLEKDPASVNKRNNDGESPLLLATRQSNLMIVELLLTAGAETDNADIHGVMPLHVAAGNGDLFVGKALLAAGADIGKKTIEGQTPLILAAQNSRNDFTALLIEAGADVNAVDNDQHSALYYASQAGYAEIVEQLLMAGAEN
ncbi:MAG: ankyrin repeat domain-containing protein [Lachnospiraceae bacterium]|nr:ankyrin repeat domain-containing protein [Lachnospiraceae bacterium]